MQPGLFLLTDWTWAAPQLIDARPDLHVWLFGRRRQARAAIASYGRAVHMTAVRVDDG